MNHHCKKTYTVRTGDRIVQVDFWFWFNRSECNKKIKVDEEEKNEEEEVNHHKCDDKCSLLQIVENPKEDLEIVSEEAVMKVEDKVVIRESITIE